MLGVFEVKKEILVERVRSDCYNRGDMETNHGQISLAMSLLWASLAISPAYIFIDWLYLRTLGSVESLVWTYVFVFTFTIFISLEDCTGQELGPHHIFYTFSSRCPNFLLAITPRICSIVTSRNAYYSSNRVTAWCLFALLHHPRPTMVSFSPTGISARCCTQVNKSHT